MDPLRVDAGKSESYSFVEHDHRHVTGPVLEAALVLIPTVPDIIHRRTHAHGPSAFRCDRCRPMHIKRIMGVRFRPEGHFPEGFGPICYGDRPVGKYLVNYGYTPRPKSANPGGFRSRVPRRHADQF